ncbi:AAA family ATPase [Spirillospora sp. NPDC047279]|uniref:helix-turn-helix transcriptional regulator n=1 Tax=Spirillospora sp. NPDC047279 TaxID=3155478 RepID=UPI0033CA4682
MDGVVLYGRQTEVATMERLLAAAREGRSGALCVHGEAGIGKTALLDHVADAAGAAGMRVLRALGTETEAELPFAGLHLLLNAYGGGLDDRLDELAAPQAAALRGALGGTLSGVAAPGEDRFLIGLATLTLLSDLAEDRPLVCLVDDAQWVDRASVESLVFAARRLRCEGVVLVFAVRDDPEVLPIRGIPEIRLGGLTADDAAALLAELSPELTAQVRARVLEEANGNPLALIELPRSVGDEDWSPVSPLPIGHLVQRAFVDQIERLPARTRSLLTVAAADDSGEVAVVLRAARTLAIPVGAIEPAERAGLLTVVGGVLRFRHPLVRSAAYQRAVLGERSAAHKALARAWDEDQDADRRAWQLAAAATGADDEVADLLERTAQRAAERNGLAAVVAAYERASQLTTCPRGVVRRAAAAAFAAAGAGQLDRAAALCERAGKVAEDPSDLSLLAIVRGMVEFELGSPRESGRALISGASSVAEVLPNESGKILVIGVHNAWHGAAAELVVDGVARLRELRFDPADPIVPFVDACEALSRLISGDVPGAFALLRAFACQARDVAAATNWLRQFTAQLLLIGAHDPALVHELAAAMVADWRGSGQIGHLTGGLHHLAYAQILLGRHKVAMATATEGLELAGDTGQRPIAAHFSSWLGWLAALEGDEERCRAFATEGIRYGEDHHSPHSVFSGQWALALLDLGLGRHRAAFDRMAEHWRGWSFVANRSIADLVDAAVHIDRPEAAEGALADVEEWTAGSEEEWAVAILLRCRAMLGPPEVAEGLFADALELHQKSDQPYEHARTWLAYGEWLRRRRRKREARTPLRNALEIFERLGARLWVERARTELRAAGDRTAARRPETDAASGLTPQESQVARLAATGATNREIAAQLLISPRTVGQHLYNAFPKLGVTTRAELARLDLDAAL